MAGFLVHFPGPFGGYFNKDRNGQPYMAVGGADRATQYETREDAEIALSRVRKAKCFKMASRKVARIIPAQDAALNTMAESLNCP